VRLSLKALAIVTALLWGGAILFVGLVNLAAPSYGTEFLNVTSSFYPGFHNTRSLADVMVGTGYGLVDGGLGGLLFAWLYNVFIPEPKT
jgi:hypothetical protein